MYKLVLYVLLGISFVGIVLNPIRIFSFLVICLAAYGANLFFAYLFRVASNVESAAITATILFLILFPAQTLREYAFLAFVAVVAMASKYIITIHNRHIFNPAAFGAWMAGLLGGGAAWWVGGGVLFPVVALGSFLIVRKTRRETLFLTFVLCAFVSIFASALISGSDTSFVALIREGLLSWPVLFFGAFMLTEPLTLPAHRVWQFAEAIFLGFLFAVPFRFGFIQSSPEFLLLVANVLVLGAGLKRVYRLRFVKKEEVAPGVYHLSFTADQPLSFEPGQYMEVTVPLDKPDSRGNRRTFTIASGPGTRDAQFGIRIPEVASSFKRAIMQLGPGSLLFGSNLAGEFVLPKDVTQKLVFIAGGVGITPFRSMVDYLIAREERRDIVLLYCCKTEQDFAYRDLFEDAMHLGVRSIFIATDKDGFLDKEKLLQHVPDFLERVFYISGPNAMVHSYRALLMDEGVSGKRVRVDYFPGY